MAAIKPHLEIQDDPSETSAERKYFAEGTFEDKVQSGVPTGLQGLNDHPDPNAWKALQSSHAELLRLSFARKITLDELRERTYAVEAKINQQGIGNVLLSLDAPIAGASWNAAGGQNIRNVELLSWTKKMGTPSFSLPAGAPHIGGACPGATAGQSIIPSEALVKAQRHVTKVTDSPVVIADSVCEKCYATGGNYQYGSNVLAQSVRLMWVQEALKDGSFVDVMSWAVEHADYLTEGGHVGTGKDAVGYGPERFPGRFFRIHDSGDFISLKYLKAWKEVANRFKEGPNKTVFWAPSRIWATDWGIDAVNEVNSDSDSNLVVRPSIYHVNENIPRDLGPGWANWSVVFSMAVKNRLLEFPRRNMSGGAGSPKNKDGSVPPFGWDCQAYAVEDEAHSCRNARGPQQTADGAHQDTGCRACWLKPKDSINYTEH